MAKQIASANAAADLATAAEVTGSTSVVDAVDKIPEGMSAALTDNAPVQGEATKATDVRETIEMPYFDRDGKKLGVNLIVRY